MQIAQNYHIKRKIGSKVALLKLPKIIAKYLFDPDEDKSMITLVEKIQGYDEHMFSMEHEIERMLMASENKPAESNELNETQYEEIKAQNK